MKPARGWAQDLNPGPPLPGFPRGTVVKKLPANAGRQRCRFDPWIGNIPWRRKWQTAPVFLPEKPHGQRRLVGYSPWATDNEVAESDMIERQSMSPVPGFPGRVLRRGYERVCYPPLLLPLTSYLGSFKQRDLSGWQETSVFLNLAAEPIQNAPAG